MTYRDYSSLLGIIFSQDQDITEPVERIAEIDGKQGVPVKLISAFPMNPSKKHLRAGINKTDWITFDATVKSRFSKIRLM